MRSASTIDTREGDLPPTTNLVSQNYSVRLASTIDTGEGDLPATTTVASQKYFVRSASTIDSGKGDFATTATVAREQTEPTLQDFYSADKITLSNTQLIPCLRANATVFVSALLLHIEFTQVADPNASPVLGKMWCLVIILPQVLLKARYFVTFVKQTCTQNNNVRIEAYRSKAVWTGCDTDVYPLGSLRSDVQENVDILLTIGDPYVNYTLQLRAEAETIDGLRGLDYEDEKAPCILEQRFASTYIGFLSIYLFVYLYISLERERERERQRQRQRQTETDRQTDRQTERQTDRQPDSQTARQTDR